MQQSMALRMWYDSKEQDNEEAGSEVRHGASKRAKIPNNAKTWCLTVGTQ